MQIKLLIVKHGQMVLYLVYNIKKNIHNLSSSAGSCGTSRTCPSAVTKMTATITTHGRRLWMPRSPSVNACRLGRNGRHYAPSGRLGMTSARAVGSGVITTRITRARYSCLLRAGAASIIATSQPTRTQTASIGPRFWTTQTAVTRDTSAFTRAASTRCTTTIAPTASACVVYKTNNIYI